MNFLKHLFLILALTIFIGGGAHQIIAQTDSVCTSQIAGKSQDQLRADLEACNAEIAKWTAVLNNVQKDSASFSRDVAALTARINAAQANIKGKNIAIANITKDIKSKEDTIGVLNDKLARGKQSLAEILRRTNDIDSFSLAEAVLSNKDFSEFFIDLDTYGSTQDALNAIFEEMRGTRSQTEAEKVILDRKRQAAAEAKALLEAAKREVEKSQAQKKILLAESQSKEKTYSQVVAERQVRANQIRAALFTLRDVGAIPFGTALQYAEAASRQTGVRPALILGILTQESNLGQNVGACVITNLTTGQTKNVNSGRLYVNGIHPTRDLPILQPLLSGLGRDPLTTKVSCPLSIGYGGAMGPAQFIPSTWNSMKSKIAASTGKSTPDPWNPSDAIMAMALFLRDLGASSGTYAAERTAACRYYGGGSVCTTVTSPYGNQVMAKAANIQTNMIDPLKGI